ncbi:hypothetical protein [Streptomyces yangpuensis]|uniref:hypothetical protein n=1 Tax=Streptomyces yangpuensis TaxID=1648182 RepID=UPI0037F42E36
MLMRAPRESGSWTWILDDVTGPDLEFALNAAARMSAARHCRSGSVPFIQARISSIMLLGSGAWFDADGERHREGVAAEPGEPTYHGCAEGYGLKAPDSIDGLGPDVSGALLG